jgi:hypothetical protein
MAKPRKVPELTEVTMLIKAVDEEILRIGKIIADRMTATRFGRTGTGIISVFGERLYGLHVLQYHLKDFKRQKQKDIDVETQRLIQRLMETPRSNLHHPDHLLYTAQISTGEESRSNERIRKIARI